MLAAPAFIGRGTPGGRRSPTAFGPGENGTGNSGHYPTACHSGLTLGPTLNSRCGTGFQRVMAQLATLLRSRHVPGAGPSKAGFRALRMALLLMVGGLLASRVSISAASKDKARDTVDWPTYLGDKARSLYSPLRQIHRKNVSQLQIAWRYDTGDIGEYQANNLIIAGVLYTASPKRNVIALDAETGKELWKWSSGSERPGSGGGRQRGLVFWENATGGEKRLFTAAGNYLYALDPQTGLPIRDFGENGSIHLGTGLDVEGTPSVGLNTPGVTYRDMLILGGVGGPGAVRAFDVRTGRRRWIFHLIPRPGEPGYETWPADAYKTATGLMPWSGQSLDEKRGIVFVATKTAEPDFYGGARHGQNLYANSLVALDAATGRRLWHYQIVHHDLLDKDLPCPPVLLTVKHHGKKVDAVAQGSKHGRLFVFNRVTGVPLWPIEERPEPSLNCAAKRLHRHNRIRRNQPH